MGTNTPPRSTPPPDPIVLSTPAALAAEAAARFAGAADEAVRRHGSFVVALSGGTTPRRMYELLAAPPYVDGVPWQHVHVLWGDERCVPPDDAASNVRMAREALLDRVPIPKAHVHRIRGEDAPGAAAVAYERTLRRALDTPDGPPRTAPGARIDLVLLGLGEDGHTASLFPDGILDPAATVGGAHIDAMVDADVDCDVAAAGDAAVGTDVDADSDRDRDPWTAAVHVAGGAAGSPWRVTLLPNVINAAAEVWFLVSGASKADIVRRVLDGPRRPDALPAQRIAPTDGRLVWLLDAAAAGAATGER